MPMSCRPRSSLQTARKNQDFPATNETCRQVWTSYEQFIVKPLWTIHCDNWVLQEEIRPAAEQTSYWGRHV